MQKVTVESSINTLKRNLG